MMTSRALRRIRAAVAGLSLFFAIGFCWVRCDVGNLLARASDSSSSPYATAADFVRYAAKLHNQGLLLAAPVVRIPTSFRTVWKRNIVTTVFWVGEPASA